MWNQDLQKINAQLSADERLLWYDRPKQGLVLRPSDFFLIPFSLLWTGGFVYFFSTTAAFGDKVFFYVFLTVIVTQMLYFTVGRFVFDILRRRNSYYAVTTERILILSGLFTRETQSLNLRTLSDVTLDERKDGTGTIYFGPYDKTSLTNKIGISFGQKQQIPDPPNFNSIYKAKSVYELIRNAQDEKFLRLRG